MVFSENIYFLILFTLPAALNIIYNAHIRYVPVEKPDKSVELAECIIFCFAVFMCNIGLMHNEMSEFAQYSLLPESEIAEFCKTTGFDYIKFMTKYFMLNIATSIGVLLFWYTLGQWIFRNITNIINKCKKRPSELKFSDVWSNVFETDKYINTNDLVIRIEKGGTLITAGLVMVYSQPNQERREFLLIDTDLIKQIFEDDEKKKPEKRVFVQALYEYYDAMHDLLIKFYKADKYNEKYGQEQ